MCAQNFVDEILLPHLRDQDDSDAGSSANESFFPSARIRCEYAVIPKEERYLPNADRSHFVPSVIRAPLGRSFAPLRMTPTSWSANATRLRQGYGAAGKSFVFN